MVQRASVRERWPLHATERVHQKTRPLGGKIERRLALALVLTALTPVLAGIWLSRSLLRQSSDRFFIPEIGQRLEQSLELYGELASAVKAQMRAKTLAISRLPTVQRLRPGPLSPQMVAAIQTVLQAQLREDSALVSLALVGTSGEAEVLVDRGTPLNPETELRLRVAVPTSGTRNVVAVFAQPKLRFERRADMSAFIQTYSQLAARRRSDENTYLYAFAALLGITIIAAVGVGGLLARGVSNRVTRLAAAAQRVGEGDFNLRVSMGGNDEISELADTFNKMVREVESNRSRIEYLQRLAAWQGMARRLAHEIKNPLTPILLAVQELHQRYRGEDKAYGEVLDVAREIVESEVGTLRRLVTEFSNFARLPRADTQPDDLFDFLRDQQESLLLQAGEIELQVRIPKPPARAAVSLDRQMFRRALANLIDNAIEALPSEPTHKGRIVVEARAENQTSLQLTVEDNGSGIEPELRPTLFDPYVTHKPGGTGLGLAIVKKIIIEHGGRIEVTDSDLGGAKMLIELPHLSVYNPLPPDELTIPPSSRPNSPAADSASVAPSSSGSRAR